MGAGAGAALLPSLISSCCQGDVGPGLAPPSRREPQGVLVMMSCSPTRSAPKSRWHFLEGEGMWLHRCLCLWSMCELLKETSLWGTQAHPTAEWAAQGLWCPSLARPTCPYHQRPLLHTQQFGANPRRVPSVCL